MKLPIVAIVGRPNVGKSTLFNRLAGERLAIVDDVAGTTRDRLFAESEWNGRRFHVVDTGGIDPTSGETTPLSISSAEYIQQIRDQALVAVQEADAVLFLVDAAMGILPADEEITALLRSKQRKVNGKPFPPILLVANKADNSSARANSVEFYKLGLGEPYTISAIHGTETGDLLDALVASFPEMEEAEEDPSIKIAIVGKPNVGKSSLLNRLVGEERAIVSPIAGTTRDAVDTPLIFDDKSITLIDTAGIRRRGKIDRGVEKFSVIRSMQAIERSDVALLMIDATSEISAQDTHIAGFILEAWKSAVVLVNKWDALAKDSHTMPAYAEYVRRELRFMSYVPILFISALTGQRVNTILPMVLRIDADRRVRLSTSQINDMIRDATARRSPPSKWGKKLRIYYGTQASAVTPPTFVFFVNDERLVHFGYRRYLENQLRERFKYEGTPLKLVFRGHKIEK